MAITAAHKAYLAIHTAAGIYADHCNPFGLSSAAGILGEAVDAAMDVRIWSDPPPLRGACLYLFTFTLVFTRALEYTQLQRTWL